MQRHFEYKGTPFDFDLCHCTMCRKFSGDPFAAFVGCKKDNFKYTQGQKLETIFPSSKWASRSFCSQCGSSLMYIYHKKPDRIFVSASLFDSQLGIKPTKHIFVKDKCEWFDITDHIPQHDHL